MILMNDFKAEDTALREAMLSAVQRVLDSGWYILGKELENFEHKWAKACGTSHGIGVGNGLDAIEISLRVLNIGSGDEVITTPMTAFATVLAILRAGATPVLADIERDTALLCPESVERCLSPKTKALVLVHLYGQVRSMSTWSQFCTDNNIALIEDCAQSHLAQWQGKVAGTFGQIGAYSFYPTKNLGAIGDGGMIVTSDAILAEKATRLRNYGQSKRYYHPELGMNSRLDEIQAAILSERLKWLPEFTQRRQDIGSIYQTKLINPHVQLLANPEENQAHVYHLFVLQCEHREALQQHLQKFGVQSLMHYPVPIHQQESCLDIKRDLQGLINSEYHAQTCLSIPCHPQMSDDDVNKVIETVNSFSLN
ncbi:DegT/DnrJ/EryC1/StrS family aminotransferase [Pseudanabaena mucicola]|uniref:DegT/DnrJ/EryC1/StrS family aminotransferase n=1 Tax=Pseudanabaena mucicola FACHB-723 TaxID=2692860 RepID=A0ABR7ZTJ1_9CYAN|nr:DegT/DnrJ/EryC1/StrS family aminotransferase [Pseudanabaena mucicola]MBD2187102.1 DegT/DnrJ/EryC1/StrS family aminotransferase [Pseudanabaena mucicola FACHB-723]